MRSWLVAGAVIEGPSGMLLVANRRRDGSVDWTTPGGVVDAGEEIVTGLTREVTEETGLVVEDWRREPLYRIEASAPDMGWELRVEVHQAVGVSGELSFEDPDGIVFDARYLSTPACHERLGTAPPWVHRPLRAWLTERWEGSRDFRFLVEGHRLGSIRVHDLD